MKCYASCLIRQMLLLFQFINSAFSDYNKDQFTPVKLEGTDEQVSRGNHKVLLFFQCCCLRKFFGSPLGSKKKKKKKRQQPCRLVFVSPEVRESSRLWVLILKSYVTPHKQSYLQCGKSSLHFCLII